MHRSFLAVLGALSLLLHPCSAAATQMRRASVEALTAHSDQVLLGVVESTESFVDPAGRRGIYTRVELAVEETWRGPEVNRRSFWVHGGRVGDRAMRTHGQAVFQPGERVVVFLEATPDGALFPTGMSQGKWAVERDQVRSEATPDALVTGSLRPASPLPARSLGALRDQVRRVP
jgi:hypothetical protein